MRIGSDKDAGAGERQGPVAAGAPGRSERRKQISPETSRQLVHELRLHQAELERQNEALRRTQAELARARARYFDLYDQAPVGYCTVSTTEHILEANLTVAALLGLACSDMVGQPIQKFILAQDQCIYCLHHHKLSASGQPQSCELRLLRADGSHFWAHLKASFDSGPDGIAVQRLVLGDVDARRLAQDRIRVSDLALKAVSQGVLITTPDLRVVSANHAFLAMTGYTEAELLDADCACLNGPLTDRGTIADFLVAMAEQREFVTEILNYRKDGSTFWNALAVSPVLDEQGRLTHFISINTDISERRLLDQSLQERNLQLQQATAMAEQANRAKSDFLSSMSHELRTPLNSILGFAQLLESGKPAPEPQQQKSIGMIVKGGWYLLTLINEILDLSGIESGKVALSLAPIPLAQVLLDCESMVEPQATLRGIRVCFPQADSPQVVIADPIRLKQVIVNLLSNAIKYNRPDGTVDVRVVSNGEGSLRISVHDTGLGLAPEKLAQLFQPFNRLGQEASNTEGTGIGLVVTRRLAELMGGSVGVHSVVGEGSIFWVELLAA